MTAALLVLALQAAGQPTTNPVSQLSQVQPTNPVSQLSQVQLDAMSVACHAPHKWLKQLTGDRVRFQPSQDAKYEKVDCILKQLKTSALPMNLGFIGNEVPAPESERH